MDIVNVGNIHDLAPGTQIAVKRLWTNLNPSLELLHYLFTLDDYYYHHGVYLGFGEVVHFYGQDKDNATIRNCCIFEFKRLAIDNELYKIQHNNVEHRCLSCILSMAGRYKLDPGSFGRYDLLSNNCETFATFLTTGRRISVQAGRALLHVFCTYEYICILLLVVLVIVSIIRQRIRSSSR